MSARYLVLTPGASGGDGVSAVSRLAVRALGQAARVDVLALSDGLPTNGDIAPPSERRVVAGRAAGGRKLAFIARALRARARAGRAARVVCLHAHLSPVARILAGGRPFAAVLHGVEAWAPLGRLERWALARARLIAVSDHTRRRFAAANPGVARGEIRVCHPGIAPCSPGEADGPAPPPFALIVGRMASRERYKGHDVLLDVWPEVLRQVPGARLVVVGEGDDRARLEARARGLGACVRFTGWQSPRALEALYRSAAFFAMPSRGEGFGLVFLEAMRAGRACIGGIGAAQEIIEDGVTGLVVDPADPGAVRDALVRLFREPGTRERMGRAGAARFAERFTEGAFAQRFRAALDTGDR